MNKEISVLTVEGMSCSHCESSVKKAVGALYGVNGTSVDLKSKKVTVEYDSDAVNLDSIKKAIEDQGYDIV
ncbi:copper chaperone [Anaerobacterium chartisolvens]|uniref:Copper chaperone CopZ n=1 Tax=Anaerobacterium chartisolvens TaxID=1297424 RepID=A0A369ALV3_9FIRM|nr:copper chaperone CopZ [Anaerobacterium chartisolvens]RCX10369.1 copper chaperone [Anaerobacterium chartisolvens]